MSWRFLVIAMGSASELDYQTLLGHDLGYLNASDFQRLCGGTQEVKRMLGSLIRKLKANGRELTAGS